MNPYDPPRSRSNLNESLSTSTTLSESRRLYHPSIYTNSTRMGTPSPFPTSPLLPPRTTRSLVRLSRIYKSHRSPPDVRPAPNQSMDINVPPSYTLSARW